MKRYNKTLLILVLCLFIFLTSSCATTNSKKINYYSNEKNYIEVTSVINHVVFNEEQQILYLGFSNLPKEFDDDCFKIVGNNYSTVADVSKELIQIGKTATFITAPKYFGDGYVMPIVSLTIDNHLILEYEIGFSNFLDWLKT